jgi:hypothetical protein
MSSTAWETNDPWVHEAGLEIPSCDLDICLPLGHGEFPERDESP